jgi:hypothetical protein
MTEAILDTPVSTETPTGTTDPAATAQPAAPSTETPARPTSMREALMQADKEAVTPAQPDGATIPPADATTDPAKAAGPIPLTVHQKALENARTKAVEDFKQSNPLASLPVETQRTWSQTARQMSTDPAGFVRAYLSEVKAASPQVFAAIQKELGVSSQPAPVDAMPEPDLEVVDQQGRVVSKSYSDQGLAKRDAWFERQMMGKIDQRYKPLLDAKEKQETEAKEAADRHEKEVFVDTTISTVEDILHFNDLNKDLTKEQRNVLYGHVNETMAKNPGMTAERAAVEVRKTHIVPSIAEKARLAAIDTQKRKAAGNTSLGTGVAASPDRPRTAKELAAFMRQQDA